MTNAPRPADIGDPASIHVSYDFTPFRVPAPGREVYEALAKGTVPVWPMPVGTQSSPDPLDITYVVLTVDNTKLNNARQIIVRADAANRTLADLAIDTAITMGRIQLVASQLDALKSKLRLQAARSEFNRLKREPASAINRLLAFHADKNLTETDRAEILQLIRDALPIDATATDRATAESLRAWLDKNKDRLVYRSSTGQYCNPQDQQKCD